VWRTLVAGVYLTGFDGAAELVKVLDVDVGDRVVVDNDFGMEWHLLVAYS